MKRLLPAIICALALHAIILSTDFSWLKLGPRPAPASRSLTITLSADKPQERPALTPVANSAPENHPQPDLQYKPAEKVVDPPAAVRLESSAQLQKQSPAKTPKKHRQKKSLKALTRNPVKTRETTRAESNDKDDVFPAAHAKIVSLVSSANQHRHDLFPAETAFNQKTAAWLANMCKQRIPRLPRQTDKATIARPQSLSPWPNPCTGRIRHPHIRVRPADWDMKVSSF